MRNRIEKFFLVAVLIIVAVCGTVIFISDKNNPDTGFQPTVASNQQEQETQPVDTRAAATVQFTSVGDDLIHDGIYEQAHKRAGGNGYDFSYCYKLVADKISAADIATINQETVIAQSFQPSGYPMFNSPKEVGDEIVKIGFDVVSLANNHMLDKSAKGMRENLDYWDSKTGVTHTGSYRNEEDMNKVEIIEKNGMKIGLVGITQYTNGLSLPKDSELKIIYSADQDVIKSKIENAKKECDMVLVNIHWGVEYQTTPNQEQKDLAKKMADWGADVIIGHHPHVIQPVEFIDKEDGTRTLVAYSLGNFISQQNTAARVIGGMLDYTVTKDFQTGKLEIGNVKFNPIVTHYVSGSHDVQIYPLEKYTDQLAKAQSTRIKQSDFSTKYVHDFVSKVIDAQFLAG